MDHFMNTQGVIVKFLIREFAKKEEFLSLYEVTLPIIQVLSTKVNKI
jgi:hypothetical protein